MSKKPALVITGERKHKLVKIVDIDEDIVQTATSLKNIVQFMELPIFSTAKKADTRIYEWSSPDGKKRFTITPSAKGRATVWDRDILLFFFTSLAGMIDNGDLAKDFRVDFFSVTALAINRFCRRGDGGQDYDDLISAFDRLLGTVVKLEVEGESCVSFPLIAGYEVVKRDGSNRMSNVQVNLPAHILQLLFNRKTLSFSKTYQKLTSGYEKQLSMLCPRFCGNKSVFPISLEKLWVWMGRPRELKTFRHWIRNRTGELMEYSVIYLPSTDEVQINNNKIREAKIRRYIKKRAIEKHKKRDQ